MQISRHYVSVGERQVHYRRLGDGPPVVMLHSSPQSSRGVLPIARVFAQRFTVFALDTPGYGQSDRLPGPIETVEDYVAPLRETLDALGLGRITLYGSATGAQIAIEFARRYPDRLALLMVDANGHVTDEETARFLDGYLPDVSPRRDGGHLLTLWDMVRHLSVFFPWNSSKGDDRVLRALPDAATLQNLMNDYVRAGSDYHLAYRAAMYNERAERLLGVTAPTTMMRWEGGISLKWADALIAHGLPPNIRVLNGGPDPSERGRAQFEALCALYDGEPAPPLTLVSAKAETLAKRGFVRHDGLQYHIRHGVGTGRPLILLHAAGGSIETVSAVFQTVVAERACFAIDLPAHGESDDPFGEKALTLGATAEIVSAIVKELQLEDVAIAGIGFGACVAHEAARRRSEAIAKVVLIQPPVAAEDPARMTPDIRPRIDGSHLVTAWSFARDERLWSPWHDSSTEAIIAGDVDLDPASLHARAAALLQCAYRRLSEANHEAAAWRYAALRQPTTIAWNTNDPCSIHWRAMSEAENTASRRFGKGDWRWLIGE